MERNSSVFDNVDEDYIDMTVSSTKTFLGYSPHSKEFEFPAGSLERDRTTSPADELFYKGNLLPLHLPPRLQMVQKLLENNQEPLLEDNYISTSFSTNTTTFNTPLESCNISPSESCRVSRELTPDEYFSDCANELSRFIDENPKRSWSMKSKLFKQYSSLGNKLKASKAYLKSLLGKSGCSVVSCTVATASNGTEGSTVTIAKECLNKYITMAKKNPFGQIQDSSAIAKRGNGRDRRSFSGTIKQHSTTKSSFSSSSSSNSSCSSFSSSSNSNGFSYDLYSLKRCSSATNSEIENPIQGAIAHCKQSQQHFQLRKTTSEVGLCSRIAACEDLGRPGLCRG